MHTDHEKENDSCDHASVMKTDLNQTNGLIRASLVEKNTLRSGLLPL